MSSELNGDLHVTRREPVHAGFRCPNCQTAVSHGRRVLSSICDLGKAVELNYISQKRASPHSKESPILSDPREITAASPLRVTEGERSGAELIMEQ